MKVFVQSEKKRILILFPTSLLLNRFTATIAIKIISSKFPMIEISADDVMKLVACIKRHKRNHKHWELVSVSTVDGDVVYVSL